MFHVDSTNAFGVLDVPLFMWARSGVNENVVSIIFVLAPESLGVWVLGFVVISICTSFFQFTLNNNFYRFGYIMPVHNLLDIFRVLFLNTSGHKMDKNYGILVAWTALNTITLPIFMKNSW